jgi:hypothetical protein
MQRITSGIYREIWRESAVPLDGGASVVVTTGLRAQAVSLSQVFGVLELRNVSGAPIIAPPALSVSLTGHLVVTITNTAAPGNSAAWQLDVTLHHSIQQGRDPVGQGAIYVLFGGSSGSGDTATWPLDQIAYFILDGDNGNDAHLGYIIAPPGTTFTSVQTSAVAIRTTDRLASIVPKFGAGRGYVVLAAPRAGGACYDASVLGDGLGTFRRDLLTGYGLQILRGSDLTNSAVDRAQLAMLAVAGPLTIDTVINSRWIHCTTPTGVAPGTLGRYRIRVVHAGMNFYAPGQNNDAAAPDPNDITVWQNSWGPIAPGDQVYIEAPATRLYNFYEGTEGAILPAASPPTSHVTLAGVELGYNGSGFNGIVQLGAECNGGAPSYTCIRTQSCVLNGSLGANGVFTDETGNTALFGGFGIDMAGGCTSSATVRYIGFDVSYLDISCTLRAVEINITRTWHLLSDLSGGAQGMSLVTNYYDQLFLRPSNFALFSDGHWRPSINSQGLIIAPDNGNTASIQIESLEQTGGGTAATPGIILQTGQYTVTFVLDGGWFLGTGVLVKHAFSGAETVVGWDSLPWTGFEVEGGQRVICKLSGRGYPNDTLPCPRGLVMRLVDAAVPTPQAVGLVVSAPAATPDRVEPALSTGVGTMRVVGAMLTNGMQGTVAAPGGYVVVGYDGYMVLRQEIGSTNPTSGDTLYLSGTEAGCITNSPPGLPNMILGRAAPTGQNATGSGTEVPTAWEPEQPLAPS